MNTCHRRIYKPVYYYCALVAHILGTKGTRTPHWFHYRTEQEEGSQADERWPPKYLSYNETMETIIVYYLSE